MAVREAAMARTTTAEMGRDRPENETLEKPSRGGRLRRQGRGSIYYCTPENLEGGRDWTGTHARLIIARVKV